MKRKRGRNPIPFPSQFVHLHADRNIFLCIELAVKENVLGKRAKQPSEIGAESAVPSLFHYRMGQKDGCLLNAPHATNFVSLFQLKILNANFTLMQAMAEHPQVTAQFVCGTRR